MAAFLVRRVLQAIVVLLIVTMLTFALLRMIPGNVAIAVMGPTAYRDPGRAPHVCPGEACICFRNIS